MQIDVRGEMCPYPAMKAREALKKLPAGERLELITDHAPALSTVPWEGAKLGFLSEIAPGGPGECPPRRCGNRAHLRLGFAADFSLHKTLRATAMGASWTRHHFKRACHRVDGGRHAPHPRFV